MQRSSGQVRWIFVVAFCAISAACAQVTDVVPVGQDAYVVSSHGAMGLSSGPEQKGKALQKATEYCAGLGKQLQTVSSTDTGAWGFGEIPSAQLQFRCLSPAVPAH